VGVLRNQNIQIMYNFLHQVSTALTDVSRGVPMVFNRTIE